MKASVKFFVKAILIIVCVPFLVCYELVLLVVKLLMFIPLVVLAKRKGLDVSFDPGKMTLNITGFKK